MDRAIELAKAAETWGDVPVGAVIVKEGQIIAEGSNKREKDHDPVGHAEIHAIKNAAATLGTWRLSGCTLIVTLEPCVMCLGAALSARVDSLVYGAVDKKGGALSLGYSFNADEKMNHRFEARYFEVAECGEILSEFFKKRRRDKKVNE